MVCLLYYEIYIKSEMIFENGMLYENKYFLFLKKRKEKK